MLGERLHLMDMATQSWVELVLSRCRSCCGPAGLLLPRLDVRDQPPSPEHVDTDRPGNGCGIHLQRCGKPLRRKCFQLPSCPWDGSACISRPPPSSHLAELLGQLLELKAAPETSAAIKSLLGLAPKTARRIDCGRQRGRRATQPCARRRPAAHPTRREGAGGWHRARGQQLD
ncbi:hypothetical protein ACPA9J_03780 [Pseudomonas aeruginosa]